MEKKKLNGKEDSNKQIIFKKKEKKKRHILKTQFVSTF